MDHAVVVGSRGILVAVEERSSGALRVLVWGCTQAGGGGVKLSGVRVLNPGHRRHQRSGRPGRMGTLWLLGVCDVWPTLRR